jgi:membrane fusion protein (multidrug efflux system)
MDNHEENFAHSGGKQEKNSSSGESLDSEKENGKKEKKNSKGKWLVLFFVFIVIAAGIGLYWYFFLRGYISTDDAYIEGDRVSISAKILGRIDTLTVDEGDTVYSGQLLAQLDTTDLHAQLNQVVASLNYSHQNAVLAEANLKLAQSDFERAALQFREKIISPEVYDHAKQALDIAKARQDIALADIKKSQAAVDVIKSQIQNATIYAPMRGVVARRWVLPGDVVQPAQPIFTVYDLVNVWVDANFEETKLSSIYLGAPVEISVDAYGGMKFLGKVIAMPAAAASKFSLIPPNNASGNFTKVTQRLPVKISLNKPREREMDQLYLLPGMSVTVKIPVGGGDHHK